MPSRGHLVKVVRQDAHTLKAGVQVVSAPQLFPTPPALAARMIYLAGLAVGMRGIGRATTPQRLGAGPKAPG